MTKKTKTILGYVVGGVLLVAAIGGGVWYYLNRSGMGRGK